MLEKKIDEATMEKLEILSKLSLDDEERANVKGELEKILSYVDKLNEIDTEDVEPLFDISSVTNVFRDDVVINENGKEATLMNSPIKKDDMFVVPKTR